MRPERLPADKAMAVESEPLAHTRDIKGNQPGSISKVLSHRDRDITIQTAKQPRKKERYRRTCMKINWDRGKWSVDSRLAQKFHEASHFSLDTLRSENLFHSSGLPCSRGTPALSRVTAAALTATQQGARRTAVRGFLTSAFGPMKMSPSKAPAITRTCFGLPTLQQRQEYKCFRRQLRCAQQFTTFCSSQPQAVLSKSHDTV